MSVTPKMLDNVPIAHDPNIPQRAAADPDDDVWVSASAGSGKTKVLTDRVLRLLLPDPEQRWAGAKPHRILCITFTKAAAALMALRVQKRLAEWAVMNDADLRVDLHKKLLGFDPPQHMMDAAKRLFSEVLDVPGGLAIMTIHAFCQSTLGRFPIEAGVTPGFQVLDEAKATNALTQVITATIRDVQDGKGSPDFHACFDRLATYKDMDSLQEILQKLLADTWKLKKFLGRMSDHISIRARLLADMGYALDVTMDSIWQDFQSGLPDESMLFITAQLKQSGPRDQGYGQKIADWLALSSTQRMAEYGLLKSALFTKQGIANQISAAGKDPDLASRIDKVREQIEAYDSLLGGLRQIDQTADLLTITAHCLARYEQRKRQMNVLDFSDLILRTRTLLESQHLDWVHYKLDEGIDHILVDEAQDTNIHQWKIVELLSNEFTAGIGRVDDRPRSFFVVGDKKQSIFSFHGADPDAFHDMEAYFRTRSENAERTFSGIQLETSFRSTRPILQLVDSVFAPPEMARYIGVNPAHKLVHFSDRPDDAGHAECWKLDIRPKAAKATGPVAWVLPPVSPEEVRANTNDGGSGALAPQLAMHIKGILNDRLLAEDRPIEPRDILVLVRTRSAFVSDLVRHLKRHNVPVSGVDRMQLNDQIAVMDCLALARFARFPDDDLSLACVLRSPFIRLSEDELMELALGRSGSLWNAFQHKGAIASVRWLQRVIARAALKKPFEFYDEILNEPSPRPEFVSCWQAFAQDLGNDCRDPLEEFLGHCLNAEADGIFGLEEFLVSFQKRAIEIKRDITDGEKDSQNQVRIMTVHASKGLEAPIVYLPDTIGYPERGKLDALQWLNGPQGAVFPLWSAAGSAGTCRAWQDARDAQYTKAIAEYNRLLYVALTRPRDRLYVMGEQKARGTPKPDCWYHAIENGFKNLSAVEDAKSGRLILESSQDKPVEKRERGPERTGPAVLPAWLMTSPASVDKTAIRIINPSRLNEDMAEPVMSPLLRRDTHRFLRGNLTHRLFEILPDIPAAQREAAGRHFLDRFGTALDDAVRQDILRETLAILNDAVFGHVFGPQSRAEVPISGPIGKGQVINGQIDRLVVTEKQVLIVDFKTNRPSPSDPTAIPPSYRAQLAAYKAALAIIHPDKEIICALLWTDKPLLMRVDNF